VSTAPEVAAFDAAVKFLTPFLPAIEAAVPEASIVAGWVVALQAVVDKLQAISATNAATATKVAAAAVVAADAATGVQEDQKFPRSTT
jgi:hypothetical protein